MSLILSDLIHPSAVISPEADIAPDVQVGPFAVIEGPVTIGPGCVIEGHACLSGPLSMGPDNFVGHGAILGKRPQSRAFRDEVTTLEIGAGNTFREYVTVHRGTEAGGGRTIIGDRNILMVGSHLGHDARMGHGCTLVNGALAAGHCVLEDGCILSGHTAIQQRVRVGRLAMLGGLASTTKDVLPFVLQQGYNTVTSLNLIGLRRAGISAPSIAALRNAFRVLFKEGRPLGAALGRIEADLGDVAEVAEWVAFIRTSTLGISTGRSAPRLKYAS